MADVLRAFLGMPERDRIPNPGAYREFDVNDPATGSPIVLTGASDSFVRQRSEQTSAPQTYYRCTRLVVRNLSAQTITVALPGRPSTTVPPTTTDILNGGNTFIDEYTITADGAVASGEVLLVEQCRSWAGWSEAAQDLG